MLNKCVLQGRFVNTPELRTSAKGTNFVTFSLAVQGNRKIGEDYPVSFIDCEAWRSTADFICRHFRKGDMALVSGPLTVDSYMDKEGKRRKSMQVVVTEIYFTSSARAPREDVPYTRGDADDSAFMPGDDNLPPLPGVSDYTDVDDDNPPF